MQTSFNATSTTNGMPLMASGLSDAKIKANQNLKFVVKPADIRPYSFYDEIKPKESFFEFLSTKQVISPELKKRNRKNTLSTAIKIITTIGAIGLMYKYRTNLTNMCVNIYNKIKNIVTK